MRKKIFSQLIKAAQTRMKTTRDPIHDETHAARTAQYVQILIQDMRISAEHTQALLIAAWWHDVARTITNKPSFVWMPFIDDILSAIMLWWHILRTGSRCDTTRFAVRLIACKGMGTGAFLTRILIQKRHRILVDLIRDADKLDFFTIERMAKVLEVTSSSLIYHVGYRVGYRWCTNTNYVKMKTKAAKKYIIFLLQQFLSWLKQPIIYTWHTEQFGKLWTQKTLHRIERMMQRLTLKLSSATV